MKTTAYINGKEIEFEANKDLDVRKSQRKIWCETDLASFFMSTGCGIKDIEYYNLAKDGTPYGEMLKVYYDTDNHYYKQVWITGDSRAAIVEDMYRQRVVY